MIGAILGSVLQSVLAPGVQSKVKQFPQEFQKIGQDLRNGKPGAGPDRFRGFETRRSLCPTQGQLAA